jgi:hypothetical protein
MSTHLEWYTSYLSLKRNPVFPVFDLPTLFNLTGQCFQDVGLTEWTRVIAKQCPTEADSTKANFDECIRDYLEAVSGFFPNVSNQLICWLCTTMKPTLMLVHEFIQRQVQLISYLDGGYIR